MSVELHSDVCVLMPHVSGHDLVCLDSISADEKGSKYQHSDSGVRRISSSTFNLQALVVRTESALICAAWESLSLRRDGTGWCLGVPVAAVGGYVSVSLSAAWQIQIESFRSTSARGAAQRRMHWQMWPTLRNDLDPPFTQELPPRDGGRSLLKQQT